MDILGVSTADKPVSRLRVRVVYWATSKSFSEPYPCSAGRSDPPSTPFPLNIVFQHAHARLATPRICVRARNLSTYLRYFLIGSEQNGRQGDLLANNSQRVQTCNLGQIGKMDEAVGDIDLDDNLLVPRKQLRRIACVRCRRRKKRCDHALPICGECRKAGLLQCIQSGVVRQGSSVTIPLAYLRHLEEGLSQSPPGSAFYQNQRDGVDATDSTKHDTSGGSSTGGLPRDLSPVELGPQTAYPSPAKDAAFSHTGYRATSTVHASDCVGEPAPGTSCLAQKQYAESATAAAGSRIVLDGEIAKALPLAWAEHYASIYFQHMQPQWPFMDQASWYSSFAAWLDDPNSLTRPSRFLVRLVVSIGALVCSSFRPNCPHLQNSQSTYRSALQYDLGDLMRSKSMLPRTQGALLLLVYAFHGSSPEPIEQCLRFAMMNCVSLITELEEQPEHQRREVDAQNSRNIYQSVVMSCHILNEVVSSGWTYPQDLMGEIGDDKVSIRAA